VGSVSDHRKRGGELVSLRSRGGRVPPPSGDVIDPAAPFEVAKTFLVSRADEASVPELRHWQGDFWRSTAARYVQQPVDALRAELYPWLEEKRTPKGRPIKPDKRLVDRVVDALKAAAHLGVTAAPAWTTGDAGRALPTELIACRNGLLHVPSRTLLSPTREYFTLNALEFDFAENAPAPATWLGFLRELWGDDQESINTLQEMFGLALTSDTSHQKAFLLVGPRRSGKGTIARVLRELVGRGNVVAPRLGALGEQFGLQGMIGKTLGLISDARLTSRSDVGAIVENLLRITGEDAVSIPRKYREDWTAPLQLRFVIVSNELPSLLDQSGALAGRFILLRFSHSFYGREDLALTPKLLAELPGILLWALDGLAALRERGHFRQPESAREMVEQLELLASPIKAFVADRCVVEPGAEVECGALFAVWCEWVAAQGRDHAGSVQHFGRNLSAAHPGVKRARRRHGGRSGPVDRVYEGIRLRSLMDPDIDESRT
jgi:putative DNA primase/helicase